MFRASFARQAQSTNALGCRLRHNGPLVSTRGARFITPLPIGDTCGHFLVCRPLEPPPVVAGERQIALLQCTIQIDGTRWVKGPCRFFDSLAMGAPRPLTEIPSRLERMVPFVPHIVKGFGRRRGAWAPGRCFACQSRGRHPDWNARRRRGKARSPWRRLRVRLNRFLGKGQRAQHALVSRRFIDHYLALLESRYGLKRPILVHAIPETTEGVNDVEAIASASPRMHGISLGPADFVASRGMKTTRVGGAHPDYRMLADASEPEAPRVTAQQDPWLYTIARMVDLARQTASSPLTDRSAIFLIGQRARRSSATRFCSAAPAPGRTQSDRNRETGLSPDPAAVAFARRILAAIRDGSGAVMIDGKMQDDATW